MVEKTQALTKDLIDKFYLVFVAVILIVILFTVIKQLAGEVSAYVASIIMGLGIIFFYATNKKVVEHINNWLKGKE